VSLRNRSSVAWQCPNKCFMVGEVYPSTSSQLRRSTSMPRDDSGEHVVPELGQMVRELWDRDRIAQVPRRYARGMDQHDWDLVRTCFAPGAIFEGSRVTAPIEEYVEAVLRPNMLRYRLTTHFLGNQLVDIDGDDGFVDTYGVAFHWVADPPGAEHPENVIVGVRYHDTMRRANDNWVIAHRRVSPDWRFAPH
jgi:hypothetical protein